MVGSDITDDVVVSIDDEAAPVVLLVMVGAAIKQQSYAVDASIDWETIQGLKKLEECCGVCYVVDVVATNPVLIGFIKDQTD